MPQADIPKIGVERKPAILMLDSPEHLGSFNLLSLRAFLVGKTIVGLQIDDAIRAVDSLAARADVDPSRIAIYGNGPLGIVALHTAALDSRIRSVIVESTLASYRLVLAISPRPVTILNPQDATGAIIDKEQFRSPAGCVFQSKGQAVRVLARKPGEPLPFQ